MTREIRLDDVGFSYSPDVRTLDGVSCVIAAGSHVAFVGPSGAGKSSILQLIMRVYDPDEGAILFDGRDIREGTVASLRSQLGVVSQDTFLFDATVRDNIRAGFLDATDAEVETAARAAELHDFVVSLPAVTTPSSGNAAVACRGVNGNDSRSHARSCAIRPS